MTTKRRIEFTDDVAEAVGSIDAIEEGRGWCNLTPEVTSEEVPDLRVNIYSLRVKKGAPVATYVSSPVRRGIRQSGTIGVLHTRGKLGMERVTALLDGAAFPVKQDHTQRGLLLEVPTSTSPSQILAVMCSVLGSLCDYDRTGTWRLDVYERT